MYLRCRLPIDLEVILSQASTYCTGMPGCAMQENTRRAGRGVSLHTWSGPSVMHQRPHGLKGTPNANHRVWEPKPILHPPSRLRSQVIRPLRAVGADLDGEGAFVGVDGGFDEFALVGIVLRVGD